MANLVYHVYLPSDVAAILKDCTKIAGGAALQGPHILAMFYKEYKKYCPLRGPTSSSCGELWPSAEAFLALRAKKELIMLFWPIFGIFGVQ